jgi:cation transport regulator ChaC
VIGGAVWLFGYGSLLWRPGFEFVRRCPARLDGWQRRFWQASDDHRGTPERPGRVVTLIPGGVCHGAAYRITGSAAEAVLASLDHRERGGYGRRIERIALDGGGAVEGLLYFAAPRNARYRGDEPVAAIARTVVGAVGPSGSNLEYLERLVASIAALGASDPHVEAVWRSARSLSGVSARRARRGRGDGGRGAAAADAAGTGRGAR